MSIESIVVREFGNRKRLDYYARTFGMTSTKEILIDAFGKTMHGSFNGEYQLQCRRDYVEITPTGQDKKIVGWDWIASVVDDYNAGFVQLRLL